MSHPPRVAIIIYSMYDHITKLAEAEKKGVEEAGGKATIFRVQETLSDDVLEKMHVPSNRKLNSYPVANSETLTTHDAYLFGIPTRYGNMPTQFKVLWDRTGGLWKKGALSGKFAGVFVSTGGLGGGQEETGYTLMTTLVHQGIVFVPLGYKVAPELSSLDEVHGGALHSGSPWGAGTLSGSDGSRVPTKLELTIAEKQGEAFYELVSRVRFPEVQKNEARKEEDLQKN